MKSVNREGVCASAVEGNVSKFEGNQTTCFTEKSLLDNYLHVCVCIIEVDKVLFFAARQPMRLTLALGNLNNSEEAVSHKVSQQHRMYVRITRFLVPPLSNMRLVGIR